MLLWTDAEIEGDFVRGRWERLMNKHGKTPCGPRDTWVGERRCSDANLAYILGINKNHPRERAPWGSLGGRIMDGSLLRRRIAGSQTETKHP
jgi:hypothetical protein